MIYRQAIIMYTISNDATRDELRRCLSQRYGEQLEELDQSTYSIPILSLNPAEEVSALRGICDVMNQNHFSFSEEDTFKFCCSAIMQNFKRSEYEYDKIMIDNIINERN